MNNITITLTREQADALCTTLSVLEKGSDLERLYSALNSQFRRPYLYRLTQSESDHNVYNIPLVNLVRKSDS
jgi:hypothetical protein